MIASGTVSETLYFKKFHNLAVNATNSQCLVLSTIAASEYQKTWRRSCRFQGFLQTNRLNKAAVIESLLFRICTPLFITWCKRCRREPSTIVVPNRFDLFPLTLIFFAQMHRERGPVMVLLSMVLSDCVPYSVFMAQSSTHNSPLHRHTPGSC